MQLYSLWDRVHFLFIEKNVQNSIVYTFDRVNESMNIRKKMKIEKTKSKFKHLECFLIEHSFPYSTNKLYKIIKVNFRRKIKQINLHMCRIISESILSRLDV
jgi:hypothetical protein